MISEQNGVMPFIGKLGKKTSVALTAGITHLDEPTLYIFSDKAILQIIAAANAFVKNDHQSDQFEANLF